MRRLYALAVVASAACGRVGFEERLAPTDAATVGPPSFRVVSGSFWSNWFGPTFGSPGMRMTGYSVPTVNVQDGELLLLIACVDNGSDTVWPDPLAPGFTQLYQKRWGNDGQSCAIDWKIASGEPATYEGDYGPGIVSGSSVIALIAFDHASSITAPVVTAATGNGMNPAMHTAASVATTAPDSLVLYLTTTDWECFETTDVTFTTPPGFDGLFALTDHGEMATKDWTTFQLAYRAMPTPGQTGTIASTETTTGSAACVGNPWTGTFVVTP